MSRRTKFIAGSLVLAGAIGAAFLMNTLSYGFSAHDEPTAVEQRQSHPQEEVEIRGDLRLQLSARGPQLDANRLQ